MQYCENCGKSMEDGAKFCASCGAPMAARIAGNTARGKTAKKKKRLKKWVWVASAALVFLAALLCVLLLTGVIGGKPKFQSYEPAQPADTGSLPAAADAAEAAQPAEDVTATVELPVLTGLSEAEAAAKLAELGLVAEIEEAGFDAANPEGAVLSQMPAAGEWSDSGDTVRLVVNRIAMPLQFLWTGPRDAHMTLGDLVSVCGSLGTTNPTFTFGVRFYTASEVYEVAGGFRCLIGPNEPEPVTRVNAKLYKDGKEIKGIQTTMAAEDHIGIVFSIDDWTGFNNAYVERYEVTVANKADATKSVTKSYTIKQATGDVLMEQTFTGGKLVLEAKSDKDLVIHLTDDKLNDGYPCSAGLKGAGTPKWEVKVFRASYKWVCIAVDGTDCASMAAMNLETTQMFESKAAKNEKAEPLLGATIDGVENGDTLVLSVHLPADSPHSFYEMEWVEVSIGGGAATVKLKIQ